MAMVWGGITKNTRSPLIIIERDLTHPSHSFTSLSYRKALEAGLLPIWPEEGGVFQQYNAPIHMAKKSQNWLLEYNIEVLPWLPYSPDLNLIKHI